MPSTIDANGEQRVLSNQLPHPNRSDVETFGDLCRTQAGRHNGREFLRVLKHRIVFFRMLIHVNVGALQHRDLRRRQFRSRGSVEVALQLLDGIF